jgi:hypothetical protein
MAILYSQPIYAFNILILIEELISDFLKQSSGFAAATSKRASGHAKLLTHNAISVDGRGEAAHGAGTA